MSETKDFFIFINHITEEQELARGVQESLLAVFTEGIEIFVSSDDESIRPSDNWFEAIKKSLEVTDLMLVLCSTQSVLRPWIQFESGAAWVRNIPLIPLCHSGMEPQDLPLPFYLLEATRFDDVEGFKLLISQIEDHSGRVRSAADVSQIAGNLQRLQREWNRRAVIRAIKNSARTAIGSIQLLGAPILISLIYYIALRATRSRDKAGEWFRMSALVFVWPFGMWFRLARPRSQIDAAILAALLIATLAGAGGFLVYRLVSPHNDFA